MELLELLGRMAVVFGLLAAVLYVLKRSDGLRGKARLGGMQVLSSTRLGKTATVSIVSVDGRRLVLGVTAQGVNVLAELPEEPGADTAAVAVAASAAIPQPRSTTDDKPGFAQLLATQLQRQVVPAASSPSTRPAPPTTAAFLRDVWSSVRRRPLESNDVSSDAVAAALALAAGAPAPTTAAVSSPDSPTSADGSATTRARASRRPAPRTDAQRLEEKRPWSRVCRTPSRTPERNAALV